MNGYGLILIIINTVCKNNKGIGRNLNVLNRWLVVPRYMIVLVMTGFFFSFLGDVCFCDGRHYFVDHCKFTGTMQYQCEPNKQDTNITNIEERVVQCITFLDQ